MRNNFWNKRIPTLLGLLFLALSVGAVSWTGRYYTELRSRASGGETPSNVRISNVTDTSFTVSYTTEIATTAVVYYGTEPNLGLVAFDNRDRESGKPGLYQVHFVTVANLSQGVKYYFSIQSGPTTFLDNSQPYEVTTGRTIVKTLAETKLVAGTVNLQDGNIPLDGVVYVSTDTSQIISGLLRPDGSYSIPIDAMRTSDLGSYLDFSSPVVLHMVVQNSSAESKVSLLASQANPAPLVTLSKNYDFTTGNFSAIVDSSASESATVSDSALLSSEASQAAFPAFDTSSATRLDILTPIQDERFTDRQPLFQGTALPNATVAIVIEAAQPIQISVQADNLGNWQFRPADPIDPGDHMISVTSNDAKGEPQSIRHSFTVFAEGSRFTEPSVSPLASPIITVTAVPTAVATPIISPTDTPTMTPTETPMLTVTDTPNLTLTMAAQLSTTIDPDSLTLTEAAKDNGKKMPASGSYSLVLASAVVGLSIVTGLVLFFF